MTLHWTLFVRAREAQFIGTGELPQGGKYAALRSDDGAVTVVAEAMTWNASQCIRSNPPFYNVAASQTFSLSLPELSDIAAESMHVYRSCIGWRYGGDGDSSPTYFVRQADAKVTAGAVAVVVEANCVYTLSTRGSLLRSGSEAIAKPTLPARPAPAAFALPHVDDFDGPRADGGEALFFSDVSATSRVCRPCDDGLIGLD